VGNFGERYHVVILLNERSDLNITTSASHALAILKGETLFPPRTVKVFDADGKPVSKAQLRESINRKDG